MKGLRNKLVSKICGGGKGDLVRENKPYRLLPSGVFFLKFLVIFEAVKLNLTVFE